MFLKRVPRKSSIGVFLGCGPSIAKLPQDIWDRLRSYDTWASNFFMVHAFVPDVYHLEIFGHTQEKRIHFRREFKSLFLEKYRKYKDTRFITCNEHANYVRGITLGLVPIHTYIRKAARGKNRSRFRYEDNYPWHTYGASQTIILDLMVKQGYDKIVMFGVDPHRSDYFWSYDRTKYPNPPEQCNYDRNAYDVHVIYERGILDHAKAFRDRFQCLYIGYEDTPYAEFLPMMRL